MGEALNQILARYSSDFSLRIILKIKVNTFLKIKIKIIYITKQFF